MQTLSDVRNLLINNINHPPTPSQEEAASRLAHFLASAPPHGAFILKGYAGTGKTTLIAALVRTLRTLKVSFEIMAPTGRAAKVVSGRAHHYASTIHRSIYRVDEEGGSAALFMLRPNTSPKMLYIVDESSMIGEGDLGVGFLRGGSLLEDLASYVHQAPEAKILFVGDAAQLPPVKQPQSPALDARRLAELFEEVDEYTLTEVVRQETDSGILRYATCVRQQLDDADYAPPRFAHNAFDDVRLIPRGELMDYVEQARRHGGPREVAILCRSNRRANEYNRLVRSYILQYDEPLVAGDRLIVCRNSYFWTRKEKAVPFIANGDQILVLRVYNLGQRYGMTFADIDFTLEDYEECPELSARVMLDVLQCNTAALPPEEAKRLYEAVRAETEADLGAGRARQAMRTNPYLNALQVKYGYAATCHKAQGGQWEHIFIDVENLCSGEPSADTLRWVYTALTRATRQVYLIAPPREMVDGDDFSY